MSANNPASGKTEYFNLTIKGLGYLSNIRQSIFRTALFSVV